MKILVVGGVLSLAGSETAGHDVTEIGDGAEAYQHIASTDLVITDLVMPGKEGLETIRELVAEGSLALYEALLEAA